MMRMALQGSRARRQRGFTLPELFVVVAVAGILAAVAIPNVAEFVKNNARSARINNLVAAINFARGDAVTRRRETKLCTTTGTPTCVDGSTVNAAAPLADGKQYELGYAVLFWNNDPATPPDRWILLRTFAPDGAGAATLTGTTPEVRFLPTGLMSSALGNPSFQYCDKRSDDAKTDGASRAVFLSATGHARISTTDAGGNPLDCPWP